jgi:hypothetical protein
MTGMKEGAGEDPFADDSDSNSDDNASDNEMTTEPETTEMTETTTQPAQIPMIFRRDSVQDGRDRYPLFLQTETKREERDALRELEDRFDTDISLTDMREALILVGLSELNDVESQLRDWGYGITFD